MEPNQKKSLADTLLLDEGYRQFPYKDINGFLTIGIGRCLDKKGITKDEALFLLDNDISETWTDLIAVVPWIVNLNAIRQNVLMNMAFNLGVPGLARFAKMLAFAKIGDFKNAAREIVNSRAGKQLQNRYQRLAYEMEFGELANGSKTRR